MQPERSPVSVEEKLQRLQNRLARMDSLLIAFSGGVDSSFLLAVAASVLPKKTVALMTISSATPPNDEQHALTLATTLKVPLLKIPHDELSIPQYAANPKNRCYFCKDSLYALCRREAERLSLRWTCTGKDCGKTYHERFNAPAVKGICDACRGRLMQRDDDKPAVVRQRLSTFHKTFAPIRQYYEDTGILITIRSTNEQGTAAVCEQALFAVEEID